jgi:hypothetical protein
VRKAWRWVADAAHTAGIVIAMGVMAIVWALTKGKK